jgi:hypothetical protein
MRPASAGSAVIALLLVGCVPAADPAGDAVDPPDVRDVVEEGVGTDADVPQADALQDVGDGLDGADAEPDGCAICGAYCEGRVVTCGNVCCVDWRGNVGFDGEWPGGCRNSSWDSPLLVYQDLAYIARLQFLRPPIRVTEESFVEIPVFPSVPMWADGRMLLLYARWIDCWGPASMDPTDVAGCGHWAGCCAHHCWRSHTTYLYLVDMTVNRMIHAEVVPIGAAGRILPESGPVGCSRFSSAFCSDVEETDTTYFLGTAGRAVELERGAWLAGGYALRPDAHDLPVVRNALTLYRTSTGEVLGGIDLVLLHPGETWP